MVAIDAFKTAYAEFVQDQYDCVDRIILNAYFQMGCSPGGFRTWWRALYGNDDNLDNNHLMRLAGRFSRRVRGWAKSQGVPLIDCAAGERKHDLAEKYLPKDPSKTGILWGHVAIRMCGHDQYQAPPEGLRTMVALVMLRDKVLKPVLRNRNLQGPPPRNGTAVDHHYHTLRQEMRRLFRTLKIKAA